MTPSTALQMKITQIARRRPNIRLSPSLHKIASALIRNSLRLRLVPDPKV
jgi:hypothetical protein